MEVIFAITDIQSNTLLCGNKAFKQRPQASLTKLMALHVIFDSIADGLIDIRDKATVPTIVKDFKDVANLNMNGLGFRYALPPEIPTAYSIDDLLKAAGGFSDGYAIAALDQLCMQVLNTNQKTLAALMNKKCKELRISSSTHYTNATGLPDDDHYSTAQDTNIIIRSLLQRHPELSKKYLGQSHYTLKSIARNFNNTCDLFANMPHLVFGKTGFTNAAGHCFAGLLQTKGNDHIAITIMNAETAQQRESAFFNLAQPYLAQHRRVKFG